MTVYPDFQENTILAKFMRSIYRILFITLLVALFSSCGSSRKATPAFGSGYEENGSKDLQWTDIRVPVTVNIEQPTSLKVSGVMTMVNDRDIHISLRMLGFEVGAAYITPDSVYAYAKLQRVYVAESIRQLLAGVNVTIADVQSLLIGAPVMLPPISGNTTVSITAEESTGQPLEIAVSHPSGRDINLLYTPLDGAPLASALAVIASLPDKSGAAPRNLAMSLRYDWDRAQVDQGDIKPFSMPQGYKRINASSLLKSLGK